MAKLEVIILTTPLFCDMVCYVWEILTKSGVEVVSFSQINQMSGTEYYEWCMSMSD